MADYAALQKAIEAQRIAGDTSRQALKEARAKEVVEGTLAGNPFAGATGGPFKKGKKTKFEKRMEKTEMPRAEEWVEKSQAGAAQAQQQMQQGYEQQQALLAQLNAIASGEKMGAGELLARKNLEDAIRAQQAIAASARGVSPYAAQRLAAMQGTELMGQGMQQAALLGAQEQQAAMQLSGQLGQNLRQQEMALTQMYISMGLSVDQAQQAAALDIMGMISGEKQAKLGMEAQERIAGKPYEWGNILKSTIPGASGGLAAGGTMAAFSDKRAKEDIKVSKKEMDSLLDALKPYAYKYKKKVHDDNMEQHYGVMAQDLEKSKAGKELVVEHSSGMKMVNYSKAMPMMLASQARLNERISKLEGKKNG